MPAFDKNGVQINIGDYVWFDDEVWEVEDIEGRTLHITDVGLVCSHIIHLTCPASSIERVDDTAELDGQWLD